MDGKQDSSIDKLDINITRIENEVAELVRNLDLAKIRASRLPELTDLKESLNAIKMKNDELGPAADAQS